MSRHSGESLVYIGYVNCLGPSYDPCLCSLQNITMFVSGHVTSCFPRYRYCRLDLCLISMLAASQQAPCRRPLAIGLRSADNV